MTYNFYLLFYISIWLVSIHMRSVPVTTTVINIEYKLPMLQKTISGKMCVSVLFIVQKPSWKIYYFVLQYCQIYNASDHLVAFYRMHFGVYLAY